MKILFGIGLSFLFTLCVAARPECGLNLDKSPALQNLRLGMSPEEASNALQIKVRAKLNGQRTFFRNYIKRKAKGSLTGVRAIFLRFFEGRLYQIELFYQEDYRYRDLPSLLDDYSAQNGFPREFWQTEYGYATASCRGFSLAADVKLNPHIQLTDDGQAARVELAREKKNKEKN